MSRVGGFAWALLVGTGGACAGPTADDFALTEGCTVTSVAEGETRTTTYGAFGQVASFHYATDELRGEYAYDGRAWVQWAEFDVAGSHSDDPEPARTAWLDRADGASTGTYGRAEGADEPTVIGEVAFDDEGRPLDQ